VLALVRRWTADALGTVRAPNRRLHRDLIVLGFFLHEVLILMNRITQTSFLVALLTLAASSTVLAGDDLFTEDFTTSSSGWVNFNTSAFLTQFATGGPDGGAYATGPRAFGSLTAGNLTIIHRARYDDPYFASGGAFKRDWEADGIREVRAFVRHNMPESLNYVMRVAATPLFPGAVYSGSQSVPSGVWTEVLFNVSPGNPTELSTEGEPWSSIFSDVGHLQFGVIVPGGHVGDTTSYDFDVDKVTISTPEPATLISLATALVGVSCSFRRSGFRTSRYRS